MLIDDVDVTDADVAGVGVVDVGGGRMIGFGGVNSFGQFCRFARTHLVYYLLKDECLMLFQQRLNIRLCWSL